MTDMVERVAKALSDLDMAEEPMSHYRMVAKTAIEAVHDYLKKHDDGFQCQQCNAMVDVDEALGWNESQTKHE